MRGVGRTGGAISLVNALATGVGCAVGVGLSVEAEATLDDAQDPGAPRWDLVPECDTPLVRATLRQAIGQFAPGRSLDVRLSVRSEVPRGCGLKSSSAVSTAVLLAVAHAVGRTVSPEALCRVSADVSQRVGVSATGAFEDAMASVTGDLVVADNPGRTVLRREPPDSRWTGVLWVPGGEHPPAPTLLAKFQEHAEEGEEAAALALAGEYLAAMTRNTELVEQLLGYDYRSLRESLQQRGALASGVSGLGPALAALTTTSSIAEVMGGFPSEWGKVLPVPIGPPFPPVGGAP
ncbi:MAG: shikimate kinase [Thermoplasmata archaeon]|nr:shikimate kinase [Thermoplasmata archaeon]